MGGGGDSAPLVSKVVGGGHFFASVIYNLLNLCMTEITIVEPIATPIKI